MKDTPLIRVTGATALSGFRLRVRFRNGTDREIDIERYLRGPLFDPLRHDRRLFEAVSGGSDLGVMVWPRFSSGRFRK